MALEEDLQNLMCHNVFAAVIINFLHLKDAIINRYHFGDVYILHNYCMYIYNTTYCKYSLWND